MQSHDATEALSRTELRNKRLDDLLQSCQEQMLTQVVGPFGLTPGMFDDKDGGNVTTAHNFEKGITATEKTINVFKNLKTQMKVAMIGKSTIKSYLKFERSYSSRMALL